MNKNFILTSLLTITVVGPVLAETNTVTGAPTDGYYQENTSYTGAATAENLGVYAGSVTATAEYEAILYQIAAGKYLAKDTITETICPAGSYCGGLTDALYNETTDQGITSCPTDYASSAAGATSINECYTPCTLAHVSHASAVTGNDYYGTGTDTCEPTECENGWHIESFNLQNIIGTDAGTTYGSINNTGTFYEDGSKGQTYYGITSKNEFAIDYGTKGIVYGIGRCSTEEGSNNSNTWTNPTVKTTLADETGTGSYCYCQLTGYTPVGGTKQTLGSLWMFRGSSVADLCASSCASYCARDLRNYAERNLAFRSALFGTIPASFTSCEANIISITWSDAEQTDINANNAGTCTYGEAINTPVKAKYKKGYKFKGWKFGTTSQN